MPNVFGPFSDEQVEALTLSLEHHLPPSEHGHIVITQLIEERLMDTAPQIRASDECSLGTYRRVRQAMVDVGIKPSDTPMPTFKLVTAFAFGGADPRGLHLPIPAFDSQPVGSKVVNLDGKEQPYVAIYGASDHKQYQAFLDLILQVNSHVEVEAYWPNDQSAKDLHIVTCHPVRTFLEWTTTNEV